MRKSVLIVEDEPNIVESLTFLLERAGFAVQSESDGNRALARIADSAPDLVILDVMLPNRSGFDILRDLRLKGQIAPKVMMLTAKGQSRDQQMAEDIGVDVFMTKPFANAELVARARLLVGL
ncbi:response regulator transcription factor [Abyssibius alkaniclasticus]|uniref:response regulator transcription factor n=1 Tax=Abyssibius alkaniclasticus TaxID=2881234 RepID=UPI0023639D5A|nr:response regulator transcription factor [Abyssibius alkaniclasticus]UPH72464.1 response regulator transcription factor [Abyssibius alkaniclasticus]